jgi:alkyl sulfatase BDS1-like metallo-beta-lactamase superfamily hydrolase
MTKFKFAALIIITGLALATSYGCDTKRPVKKRAAVPVSEMVQKQVEVIGEPRIEKISDHVWAALGYDLANTVLIDTGDGLVIVDAAMSPPRAQLIKDAFEKSSAPKGKIRAIIYTHSHIDHIGGTSVFVEEGTEIWATDEFTEHMLKQYERFMPIETIRGRRQFGNDVSKESLPVHGLGPRIDMKAAAKNSGVRLPTHTFSGQKTLNYGNIAVELNEGHGETHDALYVWVPEDKTLVAGDNFYFTFPNLYTIRGTSPRPVDDWIESIDDMRRKKPEHLIPNHTKAIHGEKEILEALKNYRDTIQWVRDETIRGANKGLDLDTLAETIKLPDHLVGLPYTIEYYGQVDWSVKAIYTNHLGWFDGRTEELYKMPRKECMNREIKMMGGPTKILDEAQSALSAGEARWAVNLLVKIKYSERYQGDMKTQVDEMLVKAYEKIASEIHNLNGRGYLLQTVHEIENGMGEITQAKLDPEMIESLPLDMIFKIMALRLIPEKAMDVHETAQFIFPDENKKFTITVRHGVAEIVEGEPLPGTPEPVATLTANADTYRYMALKEISPAAAFAKGDIKIDGGLISFVKFMSRFEVE